MTLQQWADAHREPVHTVGRAAWIAGGFLNNDAAYRQLWRLSDYAVTGVTGGSVWLHQRGA